jgi:NADP-dependent 3-hydroxy acid dehydrogenase YdfG
MAADHRRYLTGATNSIHAVLPIMIKQKSGNIIVLTSVEGRIVDKKLLQLLVF